VALVNQLTQAIGVRVKGCPSPLLKYAYVRAARQLAGESRWYRTSLEATLTIDQTQYDISPDSDALLEVVDVFDGQLTTIVNGVNDRIVTLDKSNGDDFDPNADAGQPESFMYVPEAEVAFNRPPDKAYEVAFTLVVQPQNGVDEIPDALLNKWQVQIEAGALEYLYSLAGQPWYDRTLADRYGAVFRAGISNAKADAQRGYQSGSVMVRRRSWIV
jgi:hypothetical protein